MIGYYCVPRADGSLWIQGPEPFAWLKGCAVWWWT